VTRVHRCSRTAVVVIAAAAVTAVAAGPAPASELRSLRSAAPAARAALTCGPGFAILHTPDLSGKFHAFEGVDGVSADDVWAVGSGGNGPLVEHWDGSRFTRTPIPDLEGGLGAVAVISPTDAWAVGGVVGGSGVGHGLILHWNGMHWVRIHDPVRITNGLSGVAAVSATNVYAVEIGRAHV